MKQPEGARLKRPRGTGSIYTMKGSQVLWIKYHRNGKPIRESAGTSKIRAAEKLLRQRLAEVENGMLVEPRDRRLLVDDLYAELLDNYRNNEMASREGAEQRWVVTVKGEEAQKQTKPGRLQKYFGGLKAISITTEMLNRYVDRCRAEGLANGTINRDLAALRRAFKLAFEARKIRQVPKFPHLKESPPRAGFLEQVDYDRLKSKARPLWLRTLLATAYVFGFRKSELLDLRVKQVDLLNRTIRLNAGETKSGEGRVVKLTQDVCVLLEACISGKQTDGWVFTRDDGNPIKDFRETWEKLVEAAGLHGLLFHDLRRSAVRNMVRRGVPEVVAMRISGHKTRDVFDRYNIVSESDLVDAAVKIEAGQKTAAPAVWAESGQSGGHDAPSAVHQEPAAAALARTVN